MPDTQTLDRDVRLHIYGRFVEEERPPTVQETARALGFATMEVSDAYRRLADGRVIVLEPGTLDVWMAKPFSARPTSFRVETGDRRYWGTCVWDAPGILAMLGDDGDVSTTCPDCDEPMAMQVRGVSLEPLEAVAHFSVPAAQWWDDIGFT
jgi:DNA-binding transcriptional MocR family regulator